VKRVVLYGVTALVLLVLAAEVYVRFSPLDPAVWHVDPTVTQPAPARNSALVSLSRVFPMTAAELAGRLVEVGLAEPGTRVLAGDASAGFVTLVQRSRVVGFPDVVTIRTWDVEGGAALTIWSRSRFGRYDWGVNRARIERWTKALEEAG
jgi:uncharacterized protein (DUF1499 family)